MGEGKKRVVSEKYRTSSRRNMEKAWAASRAHWEFTPARRATSMRTIRLAQAAARKRPRTPAQLAAARESIKKARAALRARWSIPDLIAKARAGHTAESVRRRLLANTMHGLYAQNLVATMARLDEDPKDFDEMVRLTHEFLAPRDPEEERLSVLIAQALWRHHRLFYAQARWEIVHVKETLRQRPALLPEMPEDVRVKFTWLTATLDQRVRFEVRERNLRGALNRLLLRFLKLRFGAIYPEYCKSLRLTRDERLDIVAEIAYHDPALALANRLTPL